ncbi:hypothetical protein [Natronomonas gomsonensis]|uniref:hypothetical protein n=1 Tax=Natronomonas gomsonensis TaxID=1046043 RepID=UPI0015BCACA3|nr:hypothetical protein [Natronomonas gomsonensis]
MSDREDSTESMSREELEDALSRLFRSGRTNAVLSWLLVAVLVGVFVESLLDFDRLWIAFVAATGAVVLLPPLAHREWQVMLPWELLVLALLPILVRGTVGGELGTFSFYLSIAALALIVSVELHMFTALRMTHWFAITFVVMTTMATEAAWTVLRWNADQYLGTEFLGGASLGQDAANAALMTEWAYVTLAGFAAGVIFDAYFRRRGRQLRRRIRTVIRG